MTTPEQLLQEYLDGINQIENVNSLPLDDQIEIRRQKRIYESSIKYLQILHNGKLFENKVSVL
jgi:hypothetical protein